MDAYDFQGSTLLGHGEYGSVVSATHTPTNAAVAIKKLRINKDGHNRKTDILREVSILREVHGHPNVIHLLDFVTIRPGVEYGLVFNKLTNELDLLRP